MIITNWKDQPIKENPHKVDVRALYNHENAQVMHIVHCLSNSSGSLIRILVVKAPKPTSKSGLL
jgi:hypothetical protein